MDLRRLRTLREVQLRGTVRAAAAALGYTPGAVSQQLSVLEREVGAALLERVGRNVRLTDAGEVLARHAESLLEGVEAAEAEVAAVAAGRLTGVVRVAAFQSALLRVVAPAIAAVAAEHPAIRVEAVEAEVEQAVPALRLHHLDVLVGDEYVGQPRPRHPELDRSRLLTERINVVLPAGHAAAHAREPRLSELRDATWAACHPGTGHHAMLLRACRQLGGFEPDVRHHSDDLLILLELARTTGTAALLPDLVFDSGPDAEPVPGVAVRPLVHDAVGREVFVLARRSRTPSVEAVIRALRAAVDGRGGDVPARRV